jgi:hypothetical protein
VEAPGLVCDEGGAVPGLTTGKGGTNLISIFDTDRDALVCIFNETGVLILQRRTDRSLERDSLSSDKSTDLLWRKPCF